MSLLLSKKDVFMFSKLIAFIALFPVSIVATASILQINDYSHASVIYESELKVDDYRLALGSMEKKNNRWSPERAITLVGKLHKKTYNIDDNHDVEEVFDHYRSQIKQAGSRELFSCKGRACGRSNSWANNHFNLKTLNGLDNLQFYSVLERYSDTDFADYISIYAVTRGNKRSYIQLEVVTTAQKLDIDSSPEVITTQLKEGKSYFLPGLQWDGDTPSLTDVQAKSLLNVIARERGKQFILVGHDRLRGGEDERAKRSENYAKAIKDQLIVLGASERRLSSSGVGSLAPAEGLQGSLNVAPSRWVTLLISID